MAFWSRWLHGKQKGTSGPSGSRATNRTVGSAASPSPSDGTDGAPVLTIRDLPEKSLASVPEARWPPFPRAVEAVSSRDIINSQAELIRSLCRVTPLSEKEIDAVLLPCIVSLAEFVHLLPASQYDHHMGTGGLFGHSLEVAYYAVNGAKSRIFDVTESPEKAHLNRARWILAAALCGLVHDIGKAVTDMVITSESDQDVWYPRQETLAHWLRRKHLSSYYVAWKQNRENNRHQTASVEFAHEVIPQATYAFLSAAGNFRIEQEIRDAVLNSTNARGHPLCELLSMADVYSCKVDKERKKGLDPKTFYVSSPVAESVVDGLRDLIRNGTWKVNEPGGRVFVTTAGCFVVWTNLDDLINTLVAKGIKAVPREPNVLADVLIDHNVALPPPEDLSTTDGRYWSICPICSANGFLTTLRVDDAKRLYVSGMPPVPIVAMVRGMDLSEEDKAAWVARNGSLPVTKKPEEVAEEDAYLASLMATAEQEAKAAEENAAESDDLYSWFDLMPAEDLPDDEEEAAEEAPTAPVPVYLLQIPPGSLQDYVRPLTQQTSSAPPAPPAAAQPPSPTQANTEQAANVSDPTPQPLPPIAPKAPDNTVGSVPGNSPLASLSALSDPDMGTAPIPPSDSNSTTDAEAARSNTESFGAQLGAAFLGLMPGGRSSKKRKKVKDDPKENAAAARKEPTLSLPDKGLQTAANPGAASLSVPQTASEPTSEAAALHQTNHKLNQSDNSACLTRKTTNLQASKTPEKRDRCAISAVSSKSLTSAVSLGELFDRGVASGVENQEDNAKDANRDLYASMLPSKTDQLARIRKARQTSGNSRREPLEKVQPVELFSGAGKQEQHLTQQPSQSIAASTASSTGTDSSFVPDRKSKEKQQAKPRRLETEADALSVGYAPGEASFFPEEVYSKQRSTGDSQQVPPVLPEADSPVPYFTLADAEKLKKSCLNTPDEVDFSIQNESRKSLTSPLPVTKLMDGDLYEGATDAQFSADLPSDSPAIGLEAPDFAPQNPDFSPEDYAAYAEASGFDDVPEDTETAAYEAELDEPTGSTPSVDLPLEPPFPTQGGHEPSLSAAESRYDVYDAPKASVEPYEDADDSLDGIPLDYIPGLVDAGDDASPPSSSPSASDRNTPSMPSSPSVSDRKGKIMASLSDSDGGVRGESATGSSKKVQPVELFDRSTVSVPGNNARFVRNGVRTEPGAGKAISRVPHTAGMTSEPHTPNQASTPSPDKDRTANARLRPAAAQEKTARSRNVPKTTNAVPLSEDEASLNAALFPNKAYTAPSGKRAKRTANKTASEKQRTEASMSEANLMPKTSGKPRKKKPNPEQTLRSMLEAMKRQMLAGEGEWITEDMTPDKLGVRANGRAFLKALEKAGIPVFLMPAAIQQYQKPPILAWDSQRKEFILKNRTPPRG